MINDKNHEEKLQLIIWHSYKQTRFTLIQQFLTTSVGAFKGALLLLLLQEKQPIEERKTEAERCQLPSLFQQDTKCIPHSEPSILLGDT